MLYFFVISLCMTIIESTSIALALSCHLMSLTRAVVMPFFVNAYVLVVLGLVALLMRICIPRKVWNANKRCFKVEKKEMFFLNKIKIKSWKERVPEMGCTSGFPKNKIKSLDKEYLWKFLQENCYAEVMHYVAAALGFTVLFFLQANDLYFAFPILFVNVVLHIMPSMIQRYNRFRLKNVYDNIANDKKEHPLQKINKTITKET